VHCGQRTRNRLILILTILLFWVFTGLAAGAPPKHVIILMIEGGLIDWARHANYLPNNVWETIEFANAAQKVVYWAAGRNGHVDHRDRRP
jgi:hypothetical protein